MAKIVFIGDLVWGGQVARGGHAMAVLQWLHGLKLKRHDVLFLNLVDEQQLQHRDLTVRAFGKLIEEWWNPADTCLMHQDESLYGLAISAVWRFVQSADALFQFGIPGRQRSSPLDDVRPHILLEQDPGYTHLWAVGRPPEEIFGKHDIYLTVGGLIGKRQCRIPTFGIPWQNVWNPVVTGWWDKRSGSSGNRFTTVADWYSQGYLDFEGKVLGPKCDEFRKFITLPEKAGEALEIALLISEGDSDIALLRRHGWRVEDPSVVSTPTQYLAYICNSAGEFSCAKGGYAGTNCGWFSDRSACYLAAGRPVVLESTGFEGLVPTGKGLFSVRDVEEAAAAIHEIRKNYGEHSNAALQIAKEYFDSDVILSRILREAGLR